MSSVLLDRCPVCRYSLQGLPRKHRCPECGFEYDEETRVWRPRSFWKFGGIMLFVLGVQLPQAMGRISRRSPSQPLFWLNAGLGLLFAGMLGWLIWMYFKRPFIAVGPTGITVKLDSSVPKVYPWNQIVEVKRPPGKAGGTSATLVTSGEGARPIDVSRVMAEANDLDALIECIRARQAASVGHPAQSEPQAVELGPDGGMQTRTSI